MTSESREGPSDRIKFGPAETSDLDALVDIDGGSPQAWPRSAFAAEVDELPPTVFLLRAPEGPVAFAVIRVHLPDLDIVNLAVNPQRRGRGLGRFLLSSLLDHAVSTGVQSVFLEVRQGNEQALGLYRSAGFTETQRRPGFYTDPAEDAILMRLELSRRRG